MSSIRQARDELQDLNRVMRESDGLMKQRKKDIRELNRLYTTYLSLAHRAGLPEDVVEAMRKIQQLRLAIESAYKSIMILQAATGPLGLATGLGGLALSGLMFADIFSVSRGY